jgi:hypothetical protein
MAAELCLRNISIHARKVLLHAVNLRHGTDGFTSPPKEAVLRIFITLKNPLTSAGGPVASTLTTSPPRTTILARATTIFHTVIFRLNARGRSVYGDVTDMQVKISCNSRELETIKYAWTSVGNAETNDVRNYGQQCHALRLYIIGLCVT